MIAVYTKRRNRPNIIECPDCGNKIQKHGIKYYCCKCQKDFMPKDNRKVKDNKQPSSIKIVNIGKKPGEDEKSNQEQQAQPEEKEVLVQSIKKGMDNQKLITFNYVGKDGKKSTRTVEPYKIEQAANGDIILWAYCTEGEGIRRFTITGMSGVNELEFNFKPRWPIEYKLKDKK